MQVWESSVQNIFLPVYGPQGVDLTQYPVTACLADEQLGEPAVDAYQSATWVNGQAALLFNGQYPPGDYMAWVKVTGSGETPVIQCGRVRIGDGVSPAGTPGAPAATWVTSVNGQAGAIILPVGATLTFSPTLAVDAAGVNDLAVTLTANSVLENPTGLLAWQILRFHVTQGAGGPWALAYGGMFNFGAAGQPQLSLTVGDTDVIAFQYDPNLGELCYYGSALGF